MEPLARFPAGRHLCQRTAKQNAPGVCSVSVCLNCEWATRRSSGEQKPAWQFSVSGFESWLRPIPSLSLHGFYLGILAEFCPRYKCFFVNMCLVRLRTEQQQQHLALTVFRPFPSQFAALAFRTAVWGVEIQRPPKGALGRHFEWTQGSQAEGFPLTGEESSASLSLSLAVKAVTDPNARTVEAAFQFLITAWLVRPNEAGRGGTER